ncbi:hypothetical protein H4R19_003063 [Coemansia spiralis]|nr:hypothetical protein H4R19_003063 [Coemansia spiralis]
MNFGNALSVVHVVLGSFVLWIVPIRFAVLADFAVFPAALALQLCGLISAWRRGTAAASVSQQQQEQVSEHAITTARAASDQGPVRLRARGAAGLLGEAAKGAAGAVDASIVSKHRRASRLPVLKAVLLAAQVALFAMVVDFACRPLFAPAEDLVVFRLGHISHDTARLHIRCPNSDTLELRYRVLVPPQGAEGAGWEPANNTPWESAGEFAPPTNETDFTVTAALANLQPSTRYVAELYSQQAVLNASAVRLGSVEFRTAPWPGAPTRLRFGSGSCVMPNFPYRPSRTPDIYGFRNMLAHSDGLDMVVFMGDFIYADVPMYFGPETSDYRRMYRRVYAAPSTRQLLRKVPMVHVYDDHEIKNNWHSQDQPPMGSALTAFNEYNGRPNPPAAAPGVAYYNFADGDADGAARSMLGAAQKQHFLRWLHDVNHTAAVKFVVSSVPVTTGWFNHDSSQDTWRGYPTERAEILNATQYVPNLFFLSGDRHEMAAVELPSGNIEFSTSPVSQFTFPVVSRFRRNQDGDRTLHFRQRGHIKYGILDVDTATDPAIPRVTYSLYTADVDGGRRPVWVYEARGAAWR